MIAIIDYGAGNLKSVYNAFEAIKQHPVIVTGPSQLDAADAIVLPGVGAFGDGIKILKALGFVDALGEQVLTKKKPYLGICLGLQFLAKDSVEQGVHQGLGWLKGSVRRIEPGNPTYRIPHIGWNDISVSKRAPLFDRLEEKPVVYFVHSYHFVPDAGHEDVITSTCSHGISVTASVQKDNIFGVQFHPEKSQRAGLTLLENFIKTI